MSYGFNVKTLVESNLFLYLEKMSYSHIHDKSSRINKKKYYKFRYYFEYDNEKVI